MHNKIYLGRINNSNLKGEFVLFFESKISTELKRGELIFVEIDNKLIPFFIDDFRIRNNKTALIKFDDIVSDSRIRKLTDSKLYLNKKSTNPKKIIPPTDSLGKFIGYTLFDNNQGYIGEIKEVIVYSHNIILSVYNKKNQEILIPFDENIILEINYENKIILMQLPEGLLDIYL